MDQSIEYQKLALTSERTLFKFPVKVFAMDMFGWCQFGPVIEVGTVKFRFRHVPRGTLEGRRGEAKGGYRRARESFEERGANCFAGLPPCV